MLMYPRLEWKSGYIDESNLVTNFKVCFYEYMDDVNSRLSVLLINRFLTDPKNENKLV